MTKLLDQALDIVRRLPPEGQDAAARAMLAVAMADERPEAIDRAHLAAVKEGLEQVRRGEFASEEDLLAAFRRFSP